MRGSQQSYAKRSLLKALDTELGVKTLQIKMEVHKEHDWPASSTGRGLKVLWEDFQIQAL